MFGVLNSCRVDSDVYIQVPVGGCGAALPTGTCTHVPSAVSSCKNEG